MTAETADAVTRAAVPAIPGDGPDGVAWQPSTGPLGASRTEDHQYFFGGVGPYFSVTTMLDVIASPELERWNRRTVAECAVQGYAELGQRIEVDGPESAGEWLQAAPGRQRNAAATIGSRVHRLADMVARAAEIDQEALGISEQVKPYVDAFVGFLGRYGASNIVSSEKMVINFSEGYAGTYDFLLLLNGELWLVDVKTGRTLPPKTGLQLAAYGHAEFIIRPNDPQLYPMPHIQRYGVLHLRPERYTKQGYRFVEYQVRDTDFMAFLAARDLWTWRKEGRFRDTPTVEPHFMD